MFKNMIKTAWRHFIKDRTHSLINAGGLAIGIAVVLVIGLWMQDELSFDKYNANYATIGQIARKEIAKSDTYISEGSNHFPIPLAAELRKNYNNLFKQVALVSERTTHIITFGDTRRTVSGQFAEKEFIDIFTLKGAAGSTTGTSGSTATTSNSTASLADANSILLSQSVAQSLFGNEDAVGKIVKLDNADPLKVTGIFDDLPLNTSFSGLGFICPFTLLVKREPGVASILNDWNNSSFFIYEKTQPQLPEKEISRVIKDVYWSKIKKNVNQVPGSSVELFVHPMKDWHLRSEWKNGVPTGGRIAIVRLFALIGAFVLLLACINFTNFSTARSSERAKEVGVRKTMGSLRRQLVQQFMTEALLMVLIAFFLGLAIAAVSLPWFNTIAGKNIQIPFDHAWFWTATALFITVTAVLAGGYPAFYISSFQPLRVLKGGFRAGGSAAFLRKGLLGVQFIVSIVIVTGTIVVYRQIRLAKDRPLGYDRNGLIRIMITTTDLKGKYDLLQNELLSSQGAIAVAESSSSATDNNFFDDRFEWDGKDRKATAQAFSLTGVTPEYGKTVGWQFVMGRDFSRNFATDNKAVILNEAAVRFMQLRDPVGKVIRWNGNSFTVVGVIRDMVKGSPFRSVQQSLFFMVPDIGPQITVRLNPQLSAAKAISAIEPVFRKLNPSAPFDYTFVDDEYAQLFAGELRVGTLSGIFAVLAVLISCLGIFGLASFVAEQRAKEIGIRKVLGASVFGIWRLLTRDFVLIVCLSAGIAIPIAYWMAHSWLQSYQYRTPLSWWIFALTGLVVLLITLLTVSGHVIKAALVNPGQTLRTE